MASDTVIIWLASLALNLFVLYTKKDRIYKLISATILFLTGLATFIIENSEMAWIPAGITLIILAIEIRDILWKGY